MPPSKKKPARKSLPAKRTTPTPKKLTATTKKTKAAPKIVTGPADLLARLPLLTDPQRTAFASQFTDAKCAKRGATTQSGTVRSTALGWAADAQAALADPAVGPRIAFTPARLAWIIELIIRLDVERAKSTGATGPHGSVRTSRDVARTKARELRADLGERLDDAVLGNTADENALRDARGGVASTDDEILLSLARFANLVDALFARGDAGDATVLNLLEGACVLRTDAAAAQSAAADFAGARDDVALGGRAHGDRDAPAVNVVEGRLTFEMARLRTAFDRARAKGVPAPLLVPPPTLMRLFAHNRASKPTDSPVAPPAGPNATNDGLPKA